MAEYNNEYASRAQGTATTTLSAITTGLLALGGSNGGLLSGLFGGNSSQVASLQKEVQELSVKNSILESETSVDKKLVEVFRESAAMDKNLSARIGNVESRVLALETAGPLKEQIYDGKLAAVTSTMTCACNATNAAIAALQASIGAITKTVVPKDVVCPEYMPRYNSWTAPTTPAAAG